MYHLLPTLFNKLEHCTPLTLVNKPCGNGVTMGETEASIFVELPVPGCTKENIEISYEKGQLLVKAQESEAKAEVSYLLKAHRQYAFQIAIPRRIDEQVAPEAIYKDGILHVAFQKARASNSSKIVIKSA
jgi:HSP20 family molecular chaperone IbpA